MKNTAIVVAGKLPSTSSTFVLREISAMKKMGWNVVIISPQVASAKEWDQAQEFNIDKKDFFYTDWRECAPSFWPYNLALFKTDIDVYGIVLAIKRQNFYRKVSKYLKNTKVDLVHCHFVEWALNYGLGLSQLLNVPMTAVAHDSFLENYPGEILKRVQIASSGIACVCPEWVDIWKSKTGVADSLTYVPNGILVDEFRFEKRPSNNPVRLISVSNCVEHKRPDDFLRAISKLVAEGYSLECRLIGDGPYMIKLRNIVSELNLTSVVKLLGKQVHSVVRDELNKSDIFVLCSERESFGVVIAEAMASGLPTVVSDTPGGQLVVDDGVTGFLFPIGDIGSLVDKLRILLDSEELRLKFGENGRRRVEKYFSWELHMQKMEVLWQTALNKL
jgi:glycosyltransferase involved in cell wall biosynthesis